MSPRPTLRLSGAALCLGLLALGACDSAAPQADLSRDPAPSPTPGATPDAAALPDGGPPDLGPDAPDAAPPDAEPPPVGPPRLAPQGPHGPLGRITALDVPEDPDQARRAGCLVRGAKVGTGISSALQLAGGSLGRYLRPDRRGEIVLVLFVQAAGWPAGAPADALERVDLAVLEGEQGPEDRLWISPGTFRADAPATPRAFFPDTPVEGGWLEPSPGPMYLGLPLLTGPVVDVPLEHARLTGRLRADGPGLALDHGILTGYLTDASLIALVGQVRALCTAEAPPAVCALFGDQINRPVEELRDLVLGFIDGYDARLTANGYPEDCPAGETCDALGVCLRVQAEGVAVAGIAAP